MSLLRRAIVLRENVLAWHGSKKQALQSYANANDNDTDAKVLRSCKTASFFFFFFSVFCIFTLSFSLALADRQAHCTRKMCKHGTVQTLASTSYFAYKAYKHFEYTPENVHVASFFRNKFIRTIYYYLGGATQYFIRIHFQMNIDRVNKSNELNKSQQYHSTQRHEKYKHRHYQTMSITRFIRFYQIVETRSS